MAALALPLLYPAPLYYTTSFETAKLNIFIIKEIEMTWCFFSKAL